MGIINISGTEPLEIILLGIIIVSLLVTAELKELNQVAISFIIYMMAIAGIFWILGAPTLSVFQLSIYAGTTGVILFASLSLFTNAEGEDVEEGGKNK